MYNIANSAGFSDITTQGPSTPLGTIKTNLTNHVSSGIPWHFKQLNSSEETVHICWQRVDVAMLKMQHTHLQHLPTLPPKSFSITLVQDSQRTAREACEAPDTAMSMHEMPMDIVNPIQILYCCLWSWNPCIIEVCPFRCVVCGKCILHWGPVPFGRCPRVILQGCIWAHKIWVLFSCIASHIPKSSMEA